MRLIGPASLLAILVCGTASAEQGQQDSDGAQWPPRGTAEQQAAGAQVSTLLSPGLIIQSRGGAWGEGRHLIVADGERSFLYGVPCAIQYSAQAVDLSSRTMSWILDGGEIAEVIHFGGSEVRLHQPFQLGGNYAFLTFADAPAARRAAEVLNLWRSACNARTEGQGLRQLSRRVVHQLARAPMRTEEVPPGEATDRDRDIVAILETPLAISEPALRPDFCDFPMTIYSRGAWYGGLGEYDAQYPLVTRHRPIVVRDQPLVGQDGIYVFWGRRGQPRMFRFQAENEAAAADLAGDLRALVQGCRTRHDRRRRERSANR